MSLLDSNSLPIILKALRTEGKRVVLTQGSFDMVHIGHGRYLEQAKSYGDVLIVGVDSDSKIKKRKGEDRPIVPHQERLEMLTYLKSVDYVYLKDLHNPKYSLIKAVKPDVLVATKKTYSSSQIAYLKKYCQEIQVLEPMAVTSTSAKIRLLQIGAAKRISEALSTKLISTIEEVLAELKGENNE
jgi:D-glycero-beta-D-manno-heptose 1-phosphate adenylyltransferase